MGNVSVLPKEETPAYWQPDGDPRIALDVREMQPDVFAEY
jgi:hypothetical protein